MNGLCSRQLHTSGELQARLSPVPSHSNGGHRRLPGLGGMVCLRQWDKPTSPVLLVFPLQLLPSCGSFSVLSVTPDPALSHTLCPRLPQALLGAYFEWVTASSPPLPCASHSGTHFSALCWPQSPCMGTSKESALSEGGRKSKPLRMLFLTFFTYFQLPFQAHLRPLPAVSLVLQPDWTWTSHDSSLFMV